MSNKKISLFNKIMVVESILMLSILCLEGCSSNNADVTSTVIPKATVSATLNLIPKSTPTLPISPLLSSNTPPLTTPLASTALLPELEIPLQPAPANCNSTSIPQNLPATGKYAATTWGSDPPTPTPLNSFAGFRGAIGAFPAWAAIGFINGPDTTLKIMTGNGVKTFIPEPYGWEVKLLWLLDAKFAKPVSISGGNIQDNKPLWFDITNTRTTITATLDPKEAIHQQYKEWLEFPSYIYIPKAGCYYLEAKWAGGSWRTTFAAGSM